MTPSPSTAGALGITVFKCQCGKYFPSLEGIQRHHGGCSKHKEDGKLDSQYGSSQRKLSSEACDIDGVAVVKFPPAHVILEKLPYCEIKDVPCGNKGMSKTEEKYHENEKKRPKRKQKNISRYPQEDLDESNHEWNGEVVPEGGDSDEDYTVEISGRAKRVKTRTRQHSPRAVTRLSGSRQVADDQYVYRCSVCPTKFKSQKEYDWHEFNIHGDGSKNHEIITCPLCGRMFNKRLVYLNHLKNHENAEAIEEAFDLWNKWPKKHKTSKMAIKFNCKYCLIPHTTHFSFLTHMEVQHPDKGRFCKYLCQYCGTSEFDSMKHLILHMRTTHVEEYYGKTILWSSSNPLKHEGRPKGQCDICKKMIDVFYLRAHKERKHSNKSKDPANQEGTSSESYTCPVAQCNSKFKNCSQLKRHFILHLENNPYVCKFPGCNVKCDAQCHLNRHMKLHTSEPIPCPKCGVSYSRIDKLKNHVCCFNPSKLKYDDEGRLRANNSFSRLKRVRSGVDNVEVVTGIVQSTEDVNLNKNKKSNGKIDINMVIRSDPVFIKVCQEDPGFKDLILKTEKRTQKSNEYKCKKCFTVFFEHKALQSHAAQCDSNNEDFNEKLENVSENETGDSSITNHTLERLTVQKVGCPICGGSFENKDLLERHIESEHKQNKIFRCTECDIVFSSKRTKEHHHKIHHRQFKCSSCAHRFLTKDGLIKHESHCTPKSTKCSKCDKILVNSQSLRRHWLLIHGIKVLPLPNNTSNKNAKIAPKRRSKPTRRKRVYQKTVEKPVARKESNAHKNMDLSVVKVEIEPEVSLDANYDKDISSEVPENFIKTEIS